MSSDPLVAEPVNTAAYIAGGVVGFIGFLCIFAIIIFILRRKQKVCFSVPKTRFPFCTSRSAPKHGQALSFHDAITSISSNNLYLTQSFDTKLHEHDSIDYRHDASKSRNDQFIEEECEEVVSVDDNEKLNTHGSKDEEVKIRKSIENLETLIEPVSSLV